MKFRNKIGAAFGCYGWGAVGVKLIEEHLTRCNTGAVAPGVRAKWQPEAGELAERMKLGRSVWDAVKRT